MRGQPAIQGALGNSMAVNVMSWIGKRIDDYTAIFIPPST
jgi:hypothetical protein